MMSTDKDFCFMATEDLMVEIQVDSINKMRVNRRLYRVSCGCWRTRMQTLLSEGEAQPEAMQSEQCCRQGHQQ